MYPMELQVALEHVEGHLALIDQREQAADGGRVDGREVLDLVLELRFHRLELLRRVLDDLRGLQRSFDVLKEVDVVDDGRLGMCRARRRGRRRRRA